MNRSGPGSSIGGQEYHYVWQLNRKVLPISVSESSNRSVKNRIVDKIMKRSVKNREKSKILKM